MPHILQPSVLKLKKGDDPVFAQYNKLVACAWHDTKWVCLLSTLQNNFTIDKQIRRKSEPSGYRTVEKPVMAKTKICPVWTYWIKSLDHICIHINALNSTRIPGTSGTFHRIIEIALVNGYIVYCSAHDDSDIGSRIISPVKFRSKVVDSLLDCYMSPQARTGQPSKKSLPVRLTGRHFISKPVLSVLTVLLGTLRPLASVPVVTMLNLRPVTSVIMQSALGVTYNVMRVMGSSIVYVPT